MENDFVYVIKPTVTDERAVSSPGLGQVTLGERTTWSWAMPKTKIVRVPTRRLVRGHHVMVSHLYATGVQAPSSRGMQGSGSCTLRWTAKVISSAYLLTCNLFQVTLIN
jgi:hypothetical protein